MWPVLTITLLLQLTDEEQLFAQQVPVVVPQMEEQVAPATIPDEFCAEWPEKELVGC